MKSISQSFHHSPLSPSEGPQRNFQQKWQEEGVYDDSCFETRQDTCPRWLWPMLLDIQTTVMKEIILYQYKRIVLWCLNLIITFQTDLILTSLSNPKKMIITKKNIAQSWGSGIRATARGYAMNANPGPAKGKKLPCSWTIQYCSRFMSSIIKLPYLIQPPSIYPHLAPLP